MFTDPVKNLKMLGLKETDIVADLGAGTGFYSVAAGTLAPQGKVYAVEIVRDFLVTIKNKVRDAHLNNVEIIWGDIEKLGGTNIGDNVADVVIVSNILSQTQDKEKLILEIRRILKQNGKVLLIDWSQPSVLSAKAIVPKSQAREIFEKYGFVCKRDINTGEHHYGMILVKQ